LVDGCNVIVLLGISANQKDSEDSEGGEESMLWDVQGQKLSGLVLVGFIVGEVKRRVLAQAANFNGGLVRS
tara:strand:- start:421 stop:633 length:213 start_codon:yes stop_codon:yes gene_type:complete